MPNVGGKKYAYTPKGRAAAKKAKEKLTKGQKKLPPQVQKAIAKAKNAPKKKPAGRQQKRRTRRSA